MSVEFKTPSFKHLLSNGLSRCPKDDTPFVAFRVFIIRIFLFGTVSLELNMAHLRLLLADDHHVVRAGLRCLLEAQPGWEVVAEASDGREAVAKAAETRPDVALLDIGMPVLNGLEAAHEILESGARTKVLMLTVHDSDALIHKVIAASEPGYVFKTDAARDVMKAVDAVHSNKTFFTAKVAEVVLNTFMNGGPQTAEGESPASRLTVRQREITQLLAEGRSTKEVATF